MMRRHVSLTSDLTSPTSLLLAALVVVPFSLLSH
jgi:hypothetical protein